MVMNGIFQQLNGIVVRGLTKKPSFERWITLLSLCHSHLARCPEYDACFTAAERYQREWCLGIGVLVPFSLTDPFGSPESR